jgi:3-phosphoshikimate 1-carboxyvinyltransferase
MPLPPLIEIVPPVVSRPVRVTIPGSKSITNRALILAALADGVTTLRGALWSEDTEIMVACLRTLGFAVDCAQDADEPANRTITVAGQGGRIPNAGTAAAPLELFVGNAGTVARFILPLLTLSGGVYRVSGTARMHQRPQGALFAALRELGYRVDAEGGHLPATIHGEGGTGGRCRVAIGESSQFASALLLASRAGGWAVTVLGEDPEESPYVAMTLRMIESFPAHGGAFQVEPDCSSASYFLAAGALLPEAKLAVVAWPESGWQVDARFADVAADLAANRRDGRLGRATISRTTDLGDSIMTAITLAPLLSYATRFVDLGRLRLQECERVAALRDELRKCGAEVVEEGDTLAIQPSALRGAEIETYNDHRVAMCFATLGLAVPGIRLRDPGCVRKTFPNFFAKLAEPAPGGLGATILDAATGRPLAGDDLLAD